MATAAKPTAKFPDPAVDAGRRRLAIGVGLLVVALVVDLALESMLAPPHLATPARLGWFALEFVSVIAACLATNRWSQQRGYGPLGRVARTVLVAGLVGASFGLLASITIASHGRVPDAVWPMPPTPPRLHFVLFGFVRGVVVCGMWAIGFLYPLAVEAEQLRSAAEVARLRSHLEPHFLLNTLNTIAGLVGEAPEDARRLIGCLGDLLRDAVQEGPGTHTVGEEIAWLQRYAEILEARHRGRLHFRWEITTRAQQQRIPSLLLQPLVENAVKHGVLRKAGGGTIVVSAIVDDARGALCLSVADDGPGIGAQAVRAGAFGLHAVSRRLALECLGATFRLDSSSEGARSVIEIPLRQEELR
jgi:signal transduction histidine kinase